MGDPATHLWTDTPVQISVTHPDYVPLGTNYFNITVEDANGNPVSEAMVTLLGRTSTVYNYFTDDNGATDNIIKFSIDHYATSLVVTVSNGYVGKCAKCDSIFWTNYIDNVIYLLFIQLILFILEVFQVHKVLLMGSITNASYDYPIEIDFDLDGNLIIGEFLGGGKENWFINAYFKHISVRLNWDWRFCCSS